MVTVITGGIKSGKTSFGLKIGKGYNKKLYIATAEPFDEEMKNKIDRHRYERGDEWKTLEEPIDLIAALKKSKKYPFTLIDCITMWLNNLFYYKKDIEKEIDNFIEYIKQIDNNIVIITNEIGLGVIPHDPLTRRYINILGILNQKIADLADEVIFMISGQPSFIKVSKNSFQHFSNKNCDYYPCHKLENQNCLFCYCPLYFFKDCGGDYSMVYNIKDCSKCIKNHDKNSYSFIMDKLKSAYKNIKYYKID